MTTYTSFDACADRIHTIVGADASRSAFRELCTVFEQAAIHSASRTVAELVPRCRAIVERWPAKIRMAPLLWINRLVRGALPLESLHLCSSLSLTAALDRYVDRDRDLALFAWLAALPDDAPALEGLSISDSYGLRRQHLAEEEKEPDTRFHRVERNRRGRRDGWVVDLSYLLTCCTVTDSTVLLRSPLSRAVRVLDLSADPIDEYLAEAVQADLPTEGVTLLEVTSLVSSPALEVLNLHGQSFAIEWQLGDPRVIARRGWGSPRFPTKLQSLSLAGGHPIGDHTLRHLPLLCPALRELSIVPGMAAEVFQEEHYGRPPSFRSDDWQLDGDIDRMLVTSAGIAALNELPDLKTLAVYNTSRCDDDPKDVYADALGDALAALKPCVDVRHQSSYGRHRYEEAADITAWSQYFEI